jgi:hypothetical protein
MPEDREFVPILAPGRRGNGSGGHRPGNIPDRRNYLKTMSDSWLRLTARLFARALVSPRLALDLLRTAWAFRRRDWWRKPPFLPLPDRTYLRWRMYTAYADENAVPPAEDVIRFARWRRETMGL